MFDARIRPLIDPPLDAAGRWIAARGISANLLTLVGLNFGLAAAGAIAVEAYGWALLLILLNRLLDGLDGATARAAGPTALGGYFDILADFIFYVSVPLAFGVAASANLLAALLLVAMFALTGVSFLAFAAVAAPRTDLDHAHGPKAFLYTTGLAEGGETIMAFIAMCLFPALFPAIALLFALLCLATVVQRSFLAARTLSEGNLTGQKREPGSGPD